MWMVSSYAIDVIFTCNWVVTFYRRVSLIDIFHFTSSDVIICQTQVRGYISTKKAENLRHEIAVAKAIERRRLETKMVTTMSSYWRRYYWQMLYKKKRAAIMKHEREMAASTSIQSKWRSHADIKTYTSIRCKVIALQCFVRQLIARDVMKQLLKTTPSRCKRSRWGVSM